MSLDNYDVGERLWYDDDRYVVYRASLRGVGSSVLLKMPVDEAPPSHILDGLRRDFEASRTLASRVALKAVALEVHGSRSVLVLQDFRGLPLSTLLQDTLSPIAFCRIAISLCEALENIHEAGLLHLDLKPANIVVDIQTWEVRLTGFSLEGSLPYMSPEQTGRIGRGTDRRSDLYSLGCTLYAMATGGPPFAEKDRLALVHAHIAVAPNPPTGTPKPLSDLILKLLAKEPADRYQSARGVRQDLNLILNALNQGEELASFRLGRQDGNDILVFPARTYGREHEVRAAVNLIRAASAGGRQAILLTGEPGIGKSSIVREALRRTSKEPYLLLNGCWNDLERNQSYLGLLRALSDGVRKLLSEPREELETSKTLLLQALGADAGRLSEAVPQLDLLLGIPSRASGSLPPREDEKFHSAIRQLLEALGRPERPLVLFLEELQWADPASLRLLRELLGAPKVEHLVLLATWRPVDATTASPVVDIFDEGSFLEVQVGPLGCDDLTELLSDSLHAKSEELKEFAQLVHGRSLGNPLAAQKLLLTLVSQKLLRYEEGHWVWNLARLREQALSQEQPESVPSTAPHPDGLKQSLLLTSLEEREKLAQLNLRAAVRARESTAYLEAREHLEAGLALLPTDRDAFEATYDLAYSLNLERSRIACLLNEPEELKNRTDLLLENANSELDRVAVLEVRLHCFINRIQWENVLETGLRALRMLGESLPEFPHKGHILAGLGRTEFRTRDDLDALRNLPQMFDPRVKAALGLLRTISSAAYFTRPNLYPLVVFRMVSLSLSHGNCGDSAYGYVGYALVQSAILGRYQRGYELGLAALDIVETYQARHLEGQVKLVFNAVLRPWKESLHATLTPLAEAAHLCHTNGDTEHWCYSLFWLGCHEFFTGLPLGQTRDRIDSSLQSTQARAQGRGPSLFHLRHLIDALSGEQTLPPTPDLSEEELRSLWEQVGDLSNLCYSRGYQAIGCYLLGDPEGCLERIAFCRSHLDGLRGQTCVPVFMFYEALAYLATAGAARTIRQALAGAKRVTAVLRVWAKECPANYLHKLRLVEAEVGRVRGRSYQAVMALFQESIREARSRGFHHEEALAQELAGRYADSYGFESASRAHLAEATSLYLQWGAKAVARRLVRDFPELDPLLTRSLEATAPGRTETLDLATIVSAAQVLSQEIVLERLLETLTHLLLQNAGAERALLILNSEEGPRLQAEAGRGSTEVLQAEPLEGSDRFCRAVVEFVLRTGEPVVLEDALHIGDFQQNFYVVERQARSVLCAPLRHRGQIAGALYLENNQANRVFTPERIRVVQVLASQAVISLENAYHFQKQQSQHEEILREREARYHEEIRAKELAVRKDTLAGFLGIAAHDLRNSLLAIELWTGQLGGDHVGKSVQRAKRLIEEACAHAHGLVRSYLDASQLEVSGQLVLRPNKFSLDGLVREALAGALRSLPEERQQEISVEERLDPIDLLADRDRLMQVLLNLIGNAFLYCPGQVKLNLCLARVKQRVRFDLRDNGRGVTPEQAEDLFEPFRRASTGGDGRGLGLWICRVIVEAHGGAIGVESSAQGGHFWFELPEVPSPPAEGEHSESLRAN